MRVAGIDGTRGGWVAVVLERGRFERALLLRPVECGFDELGNVAAIGIDVPIGFGPRAADAAARAYLRGNASTVFPAPAREQLTVVPYRAGLGVSAQAHALGPRILHVTALAASDTRLHEVHPEVSFRAMNGGEPLAHRKKAAGGALERIALLRVRGIELGELGDAGAVPLDDVLDATAVAWSARRIAAGRAVSLPDPPEVVDGRDIAIWY
jgi:predicted RNase H-like nuclease